jgi:3,4-dihydroxy 2-butanone 4-phosphate synthase/GTP cyclohydrolase II
MRSKYKFDTIEDAIQDIKEGKMIILVDDEDRENEGDLTMAAEKVTPEAINFMAKYGRGLICLSLTPEKCDELQLPMMAAKNTSSFGTGFTVSIEAKNSTGISAADRATTIRPPSTRHTWDLARPGCIPAQGQEGRRAEEGRTDRRFRRPRATCGLSPAGVICEQ